MSPRPAILKNSCIFLFVCLLIRPSFLFSAEDKNKNSSTQQVGGLLFDVDEGVKIEHGPGGSVYVKSNREYMQEKFKSLDGKIALIEQRLDRLESAAAAKSKKETEDAASAESAKRVLVT